MEILNQEDYEPWVKLWIGQTIKTVLRPHWPHLCLFPVSLLLDMDYQVSFESDFMTPQQHTFSVWRNM